MRLLVVCVDCRRQYDATDHAPGSQFHCHCGSIVEVQVARGHDAAVVRCSSCGAPREAGSAGCGFCHSDFSLHERDMHTVCPGCLTRISDRAKFCHHCGVRITAEMTAGSTTTVVCPACEKENHLVSRALGKRKIAVLECERCAGLWLGMETFDHLTELTSQETFDLDDGLTAGRDQQQDHRPPPSRHEWNYRTCPLCEKLMQRRNYGRKSGVIIDSCRKHGVWLDGNELPRILKWIRSGGSNRAKRQLEEARRADKLRKSISEIGSDRSGYGHLSGLAGGYTPDDDFDILATVIGSLFRRRY